MPHIPLDDVTPGLWATFSMPKTKSRPTRTEFLINKKGEPIASREVLVGPPAEPGAPLFIEAVSLPWVFCIAYEGNECRGLQFDLRLWPIEAIEAQYAESIANWIKQTKSDRRPSNPPF